MIFSLKTNVMLFAIYKDNTKDNCDCACIECSNISNIYTLCYTIYTECLHMNMSLTVLKWSLLETRD